MQSTSSYGSACVSRSVFMPAMPGRVITGPGGYAEGANAVRRVGGTSAHPHFVEDFHLGRAHKLIADGRQYLRICGLCRPTSFGVTAKLLFLG